MVTVPAACVPAGAKILSQLPPLFKLLEIPKACGQEEIEIYIFYIIYCILYTLYIYILYIVLYIYIYMFPTEASWPELQPWHREQSGRDSLSTDGCKPRPGLKGTTLGLGFFF